MALRVLLGLPAVLVCLLATASMAFRFGWNLGSEEIDKWIYASAGVAVDLIKALLPLLIVWAWIATPRRWAYCIIAGLFFLLFTSYSLLASFGLAAIQSANKLGAHAAVAVMYEDRRADLNRLRAERSALPPFTTTTGYGVQAAQAAVTTAVDQVKPECSQARGGRGSKCRAREADERAARATLLKMQRDKAMTDRAADIDARIDVARAELAKVDIKEAIKEADPQAAALALLGGRFIGDDKQRIRTRIHAILAIVLEAGSGFGLYLIFGSHAMRWREQHQSAPNPVQRPALISAPDHDKRLTIEAPTDAIERFFRECVRPALGERVSASVMSAAYEQWCTASEREPVSPNMFGRRAPWRKDRIGGRVWYLDACLSGEFTSAARR
jgi:hypothetical protein